MAARSELGIVGAELYSDYLKELARRTAIYPDVGKSNSLELMYLALGLTGEAGEVANKIKKIYRDQDKLWRYVTGMEARREDIKSELGDVMWYVLMLCGALNLDLFDVIESTLDKLEDRQSRNVLHGDGDNR